MNTHSDFFSMLRERCLSAGDCGLEGQFTYIGPDASSEKPPIITINIAHANDCRIQHWGCNFSSREKRSAGGCVCINNPLIKHSDAAAERNRLSTRPADNDIKNTSK
jgi:hypothetical protein